MACLFVFFQQQLRRDAHCHQFLHQQLASVGHFNGVDVFAFARDAVQLPTVVRNDGADQAAVFADGGVVGIGGQHHPFVQHRRCTGSNAAIPFHFAPSQSAPVSPCRPRVAESVLRFSPWLGRVFCPRPCASIFDKKWAQ